VQTLPVYETAKLSGAFDPSHALDLTNQKYRSFYKDGIKQPFENIKIL
jgi:hypothetical protein